MADEIRTNFTLREREGIGKLVNAKLIKLSPNPPFAALPELPTISASADDAANGDRASGDGANEDGATGLASSFVQRLWGLGLLAIRLLRFWEER